MASRCGAVVAEAVAAHGRIDLLVNNAGMVICGEEECFTAFQDLDEEEWDFDIAINLKTQFLVTRNIVPLMIERGYGRIVNVSSVTGPIVANPEESAYCAAKAGVLGMTRGLALDVAKHGVTVNAVGPGWIATGSQADGEDVGGLNTPMGRSALPKKWRRPSCSSPATTPATSPASCWWSTAATRSRSTRARASSTTDG